VQRHRPGRALEVTLDSGPPHRFGGIEVRGTKRYPRTAVSNLSPVRPGRTYDREVLELYTRRLLETGYFAGGRVELAPGPAEPDAAPVLATVIEGNSQNIESGVSFNTDAGLRLELSHRNVDLFETAWRGRTQLRLDQLTQEARYELESPPRPGATWWSAFAGGKKEVIQNEEDTELAAGLAHNWAGAGAPSALLVSAHAEEQRVSGGPPDHRHAVYFGLRFGFRDTDDIVQPRRGYFGLVSAGVAPDALSTQGFSRGTARALDLELRRSETERPAQAAFGAEQPEGPRRRDERQGDGAAHQPLQPFQPVHAQQNTNPTEKCRRQLSSASPYAASMRIGPIGVRKRAPPPMPNTGA